MTRLRRFSTLLLAVLALSTLLAACSEETPEQTAEPMPVVTAQLEDAPAIETSESAIDSGTETVPELSPSDLTAAIVSGDSAGDGKPFTFDATQSLTGDLAIVNYQWNMGDGTTLFGVSVEHAYDEPGFYTVSLTVIDAEGNTDVTAKVVEITELTEEPSPTNDAEFTLAGTTWVMDKPLRGTTVTLTFNKATISGSSGCNSYEASYAAVAIEGEPFTISVGTISSSGQLCTSEIMAQETGYLESLASATSITVNESTLGLETGSGTLTFSQVE